MATEVGKSGYEGEKDIAAQKEIYAAFLELMLELIKSIPGLIPSMGNLNSIEILKAQGLTIERKSKGQDFLEVEQKIPTATQTQTAQSEQSKGIQTLYGNGQNNLTPDNIKAIAAIIAGKQGDTVVGGEGFIIKFNGKTLFETDEKGKISLHTEVSPEIKQRFAALQAGRQNPTPLPASTPTNAASPAPKSQQTVSQSKIQDQVGNLFANLVNSLPAIGVPKVSGEKPAASIDKENQPKATNAIILPPNFKAVEREADSKPALNVVADPLGLFSSPEEKSSFDKSEPEIKENLDAEKLIEPVASHAEALPDTATDLPVDPTEQPATEPLEEQLAPSIEPLPANVTEPVNSILPETQNVVETEQPTEPVVSPKKSILNDVGDYIADRAKKDTQVVADAVTQKASDAWSNLSQGLPSVPGAIIDQYRTFRARLTNSVVSEDDPKLKASVNDFMDQVGDMFDELKQDDPNLGLSARHAIDETIEPDYEDEPEVEIDNTDDLAEQEYQYGIEKAERDFERQYGNLNPTEGVNQSPDMGDDNAQGVAVENSEPIKAVNISKPAKLKPVSIEHALNYMSRRDDGAKAQDGKGYNFSDTHIGTKLTTQIDAGEPLNKVQAEDALGMLRKYHKQFAEGGIKLPTWNSVKSQYLNPVIATPDIKEIFSRQQQKLDETKSPEEKEAVLKAAFKLHVLNMPEQDNPNVPPGRYAIDLPTGAKFVNNIDDLGINHLSLERGGDSYSLGGVASKADDTRYVPGADFSLALYELRQLKAYLKPDLSISPEPVSAIPLTQPLPIASESLEPTSAAIEKPFTIPLEDEPFTIKPGEEPVQEQVKIPAMSRGGR